MCHHPHPDYLTSLLKALDQAPVPPFTELSGINSHIRLHGTVTLKDMMNQVDPHTSGRLMSVITGSCSHGAPCVFIE